jgi:hypothetical protein
VWGCGGAWRGTRRAQTIRGLAAPAPRRIKSGQPECKHFLLVCRESIAPQGTKNNRPPSCNKRDRHVMEVCKINVHQSIVAVARNKGSYKFFHPLFRATATPSSFILLTGMKCLARLFARGHQQKVRSTPFLPCARLRWQGLRGGCICVGSFQGMVFLYLRSQLFGAALFVFLRGAWTLVSHVNLNYSDIFSFLQ